jgi:hypothetical protein
VKEMITQTRRMIEPNIGSGESRPVLHSLGKGGQALVELTIFAAIFLFALSMFIQYGLSLNYQQEDSMLAFRKGLNEAYKLSQYSRSGQVVMLKDRAFPEADDSLGTPSHYPVYGAASAIWSNALYGLRTQVTQEDGGKILMEINDRQITGADGENLYLSGTKSITGLTRQSVLYRKVGVEPDCAGPIYECENLYNGGRSWKWEKVSLQVGQVIPEDLDGVPEEFRDKIIDAVRAASQQKAIQEFTFGKYFDVDSQFEEPNPGEIVCSTGDCKEEEITSVRVAEVEIDNVIYFYVDRINVLDFQEGDIDLTIDSRDMANDATVTHQGIQPGYAKAVVSDSQFIREENFVAEDDTGVPVGEPDAIRTVTDIDASETLRRTVLLKSGSGANQVRSVDVASEFKVDRNLEWVTQNE